MIELPRRRFLVGLAGVAALVASPSLVRACNIMPVRAIPLSPLPSPAVAKAWVVFDGTGKVISGNGAVRRGALGTFTWDHGLGSDAMVVASCGVEYRDAVIIDPTPARGIMRIFHPNAKGDPADRISLVAFG